MKYYSTLSFLKSWNNYSVSEYILTYFTHLYGHLKLIPPTQENYDFLIEKGNFKYAEINYVQKNLIVFASPKIPRFFLSR